MVYARSGTICSYPAFTVNDFNLDKSSQKHLTLILVGVSLVLSTVLLRIFSLQAVFIMALSMVSCEEHVYILLATTGRLGFFNGLLFKTNVTPISRCLSRACTVQQRLSRQPCGRVASFY